MVDTVQVIGTVPSPYPPPASPDVGSPPAAMPPDLTDAIAATQSYRDQAQAAAAIAEAAMSGIDGKADKTTQINTSGLATGGSTLAGNMTITVAKASGAEALAGTDDTKAVTPLALKSVADVKAALVHTHLAADITDSTAAGRALLTAADVAAQKTALGVGSANGIAPLASDGKVSTSYLPDAVLGALKFQGTWNASTNSPTIPAASSSNKGFYYLVQVDGTTTVSGVSDWKVGDWLVSNGSSWDKIDNTDAVTSVAGRTGAVTLAVADVSGAAPLASPTFTGTPAAPTPTTGDNTTKIATTAFVQASLAGVGALILPRAYLAGLQLSNDTTDATNDIQVTAGQARSDDDTANLVTSATIIKQIDATFTEYSLPGTASGGRASADNTTGAKWFHVFLIGGSGKNTQPFFATSLSPTLPSGFTLKRRIGSIYWTGTAIKTFVQTGDNFRWMAESLDMNGVWGDTSVLTTLLVPLGVKVEAFGVAAGGSASGNCFFRIDDPAATDTAAGGSNSVGNGVGSSGVFIGPFGFRVVTNTSSQIRRRSSASTASGTITTQGWIDRRGRDD